MFKVKSELKAEIEMLKGLLVVKDKEIEFYKQRGDKYFTSMNMRDDESKALLNLAKELLGKIVEYRTEVPSAK